MEITVAQEQVFRLVAHMDPAEARVRVEEKKVALVAGTFGALLSRPRPEEIELTYSESRLEPIWQLTAQTHLVYERQHNYAITIDDKDVSQVSFGDQTLAVSGGRISLAGVEHGESSQKFTQTFDGKGTPNTDLARLVAGQKEGVADLAGFLPDGFILVPPEATASAVLARALHQLSRPKETTAILTDACAVEQLVLYLRPIYAFEYHWPQKGKYAVVEFDGLSGEMKLGHSRKDLPRVALQPALLFDATAEALARALQALGPTPNGNPVLNLVKSLVK